MRNLGKPMKEFRSCEPSALARLRLWVVSRRSTLASLTHFKMVVCPWFPKHPTLFSHVTVSPHSLFHACQTFSSESQTVARTHTGLFAVTDFHFLDHQNLEKVGGLVFLTWQGTRPIFSISKGKAKTRICKNSIVSVLPQIRHHSPLPTADVSLILKIRRSSKYS